MTPAYRRVEILRSIASRTAPPTTSNLTNNGINQSSAAKLIPRKPLPPPCKGIIHQTEEQYQIPSVEVAPNNRNAESVASRQSISNNDFENTPATIQSFAGQPLLKFPKQLSSESGSSKSEALENIECLQQN